MSREKTERLFNLTLALLGTRNFLTKSQILNSVQGYDGPSESADRMFERDKDDLRDLGIPIEVRQIDPLFEDEPGYRIDRRRYQLPPLTFSAREMALLSIAAQAWQQGALAGPAAEGLRKLVASGADPDPDLPMVMASAMRTQEPAFAVVWASVRESTALRFDYRRSGEAISRERQVDPWGLLARNGVWYLVARDHDNDQPRVFRLSRMESVRTTGKSNAFRVPDGVDIWAHAYLLDPSRGEQVQARVKIEPGHAVALVRRGTHVADDIYLLEYHDDAAFASEIAPYSEFVTVLEPQSLRERVIALLSKAEANHG